MEDDLILYSVNAIRSMEVIDVSTGSKLGYVRDYKVDLSNNKVVSLFLPSTSKGWFSKEDDIEIPWEKVVKIGVDVLIVDASGIQLNTDENKI
ncbi:MAG: YlmC/YmxH family sporulation protein [Clostridium sp.]|uniref:YlmC/YmxH family sporulation protein n=1 Tax=Clostridium sp. TaxID=1506 RepID=UPI0025C60D79|nr:YlmC/YmxH family sporulation protein [Clostridium sp.]MBS4958191.1 YlmC/YmxH family sporulation protein [Clostridium sp.]